VDNTFGCRLDTLIDAHQRADLLRHLARSDAGTQHPHHEVQDNHGDQAAIDACRHPSSQRHTMPGRQLRDRHLRASQPIAGLHHTQANRQHHRRSLVPAQPRNLLFTGGLLLTSGFGVRVPGGVLGEIHAHQQVLSFERILLVGVVDL
jgi:hypothetical protein